MTIFKLASQVLLFFLLGCGMSACTPDPQLMISPTAALIPTATAVPLPSPSPLSPSSPSPEPPDTGWQVLGPGLERRMIRLYNDENQHIESLYIWRLDQNLFRLDVAYQETPQSLEDWQAKTNALLVVNGGYFRVENERYFPNGLTIL